MLVVILLNNALNFQIALTWLLSKVTCRFISTGEAEV